MTIVVVGAAGPNKIVLRKVDARAGRVAVDLRLWYQTQDNYSKPTAKGFIINEDTWPKIRDRMDKLFARKDLVPISMRSDVGGGLELPASGLVKIDDVKRLYKEAGGEVHEVIPERQSQRPSRERRREEVRSSTQDRPPRRARDDEEPRKKRRAEPEPERRSKKVVRPAAKTRLRSRD